MSHKNGVLKTVSNKSKLDLYINFLRIDFSQCNLILTCAIYCHHEYDNQAKNNTYQLGKSSKK